MNGRRLIAGTAVIAAIGIGLWQTNPASGNCGSCGAAKTTAAKSCPSKAKCCPAKTTAGHARIGKPAPNFTLSDANGKRHSLSDHKGHIVVLEWTSQQCPYVVAHHTKQRTTQKLYAQYVDKGVVWLGVESTHWRKPAENRAWSAKHGIAYPILHDTTGKVGRAYKAKTTPHVFVIDKDGTLVYSGAIDDQKGHNYVAAALDSVLAGKPVAQSETKPYGCGVKYGRQVAKAGGNGGNGGNGGSAKACDAACKDKKDCCGSASCPPQGCGAKTAKAGGNGGNGGESAKPKKAACCGTCK